MKYKIPAPLPLLHCQQHVLGCQTSDLRCLRLLPGVTFCITKITSIYEYVLIFLLIFTESYWYLWITHWYISYWYYWYLYFTDSILILILLTHFSRFSHYLIHIIIKNHEKSLKKHEREWKSWIFNYIFLQTSHRWFYEFYICWPGEFKLSSRTMELN